MTTSTKAYIAAAAFTLTGCYNPLPNEAELWRCKPDEMPKVVQYRQSCEKSTRNAEFCFNQAVKAFCTLKEAGL